jgi:replicative DNA helicase
MSDNTSNLLLGLFLRHDFWESNHLLMGENYFEAESKKIYGVMSDAHKKYERDLTLPEVEALLWANNPMLTASQRAMYVKILETIKPVIGPDVAEEVIKASFREQMGQTVAQIGMDLIEGEEVDLSKLREIVDKYEGGFIPDRELEVLSTEFDDILEYNRDKLPWTFNIDNLNNMIPGIGPGNFGIVFALVESGKSAFGISLCFGPNGFAEQGARVLYIANEEPAEATRFRAVMSNTGFDEQRLLSNRHAASDMWRRIKDNVLFHETTEIRQLEGLVKKHRPDIVVIDQMDKLNINGSYARDDLKLSEIYRRGREIAKKNDCSVIAVTQADASADGRTSLRFTQMSGSKIGKPAEADYIIGLGKEATDNGQDNYLRYLTVSKNKIGGRHGRAIVKIQPEVSRYHD